MRFLDLPPIWLLFCLALVWFSPWTVPWGGLFWMGLLPLLAAGVLTVLALLEFRRARTTVIPHQAPSALITSGIFGLTRNPIYLADMLILLGFALLWGKWSGFLLLPVLYLILDRRFIRPEEQRLRATFPETFAAYMKTTRRWI